MVPLPAVGVLQAGTPTPEVGPDAIVDFVPAASRAVWFAVGFALVLLLGWYVLEPLLSRMVRRRNTNNPTLQEAVSRYIRLLVVILALATGLGFAGYGRILGGSAIVIAAATLAIGVAGQSVIGSLVSGIVLVFDPEFNVGNYIEWDDTSGTVQSITLRVTRVLTPAGELVTIPNTQLTSHAIKRPYGRGRSRVVEPVAIAYEDDVDEALSTLVSAAAAVDGIAADPAPQAYLDEFGDDAVLLRAHYWVERGKHGPNLDIESEYARTAKRRLEEVGITIAPPAKRELLGRVDVDEGP